MLTLPTKRGAANEEAAAEVKSSKGTIKRKNQSKSINHIQSKSTKTIKS
jgi:hypothetical protein